MGRFLRATFSGEVANRVFFFFQCRLCQVKRANRAESLLGMSVTNIGEVPRSVSRFSRVAVAIISGYPRAKYDPKPKPSPRPEQSPTPKTTPDHTETNRTEPNGTEPNRTAIDPPILILPCVCPPRSTQTQRNGAKNVARKHMLKFDRSRMNRETPKVPATTAPTWRNKQKGTFSSRIPGIFFPHFLHDTADVRRSDPPPLPSIV